ncbi:MAG: bifunctional 3-(3-hydroxy-phenyl)propionate/3-hydroxycinnamic acid hydroxylase [Acidimicrobiales bacterium]
MTPAPAEVSADVAVVGYGPTGAALAVLLAQAGHRVVVLERQPEPYPLPRAVHFDHEVGRILQSCGIGHRLRTCTEPGDVYEWRNGSGTVLLRLGHHGPAASGWPMSSMFHQPTLEALLDDRVRALPSIEVRRGSAVTGLEPTGDGVTATTADGATISARYLVGCDGANSTVRSLTETPVHDLGFFYDWLIVDVILDPPRVFSPLNVQICDPARPTTVVSGGPGRRRWEFMRLPEEPGYELDDLGRAWELLAPWDVTPANATLERHAIYTFQARYAERWRTGRVLLAGDAAHQMPPFAGQGMCAGLRDAANLAWKLDLVLAGHAPDRLLDAYGEERLPGARTAIETSMELGRMICVPDPEAAAARDEAMSAQVGAEPVAPADTGGVAAGIIDTDSPHAGRLFVQGLVGGRLFDDAHGAGWRLITIDDRIPPLPDAFAAIGGRAVTVESSDPTFGRWFADHDTRWALQRPDFHLYGTATTAPAARRLVESLTTRLSQGAPS